MGSFSESVVEDATLTWMEGAGWQARDGAENDPGDLLHIAATTSRWVFL
ncbi:hypothetical protein [Accumulibacter sp.]|nr:hypothetical protein [Accumulibacter sp.]MCM8595740.1 hypothetical protein [Accumulibacter sp.]MCM8625382.1 hypothetical protein [Accumulibacter sp.]MDS4049887.1 hypothetical protein [Accumulibacter sp.]